MGRQKRRKETKKQKKRSPKKEHLLTTSILRASMIRRSDKHDRRILNFPAVHPCEEASLPTLLDSLTVLSRSICSYRSSFPVRKRKNARDAIRHVEILLMFFEELRDQNSIHSESGALCFSELHIAFQKIQFLLEDFSRDGARLWISMKSHLVSNQFRLLMRSLTTALDVMPMNVAAVTEEMKELIDMVVRQARNSKFDIDKDEEMALNRVRFILYQFENSILPERAKIRKVLDHLDIRSWRECNKEIKFLEEEIVIQSSNGEEREVPLLSSLVAFMSYCRATMFENFDYTATDDQMHGQLTDSEFLKCLNPEDFRCPISLELMIDPVTISTGQTYDRSSIQKWLKSGNLICPKTGEKLKTPDVVPNLALKKIIQQYCVEHDISISKSSTNNHSTATAIVAGSAAAAEIIKFLSQFLTSRLVYGTPFQKNKAAFEIRLLSKSNIFNRSCLIEAGVIPPLLNLLASPDPSTQDNAISAVLKLSKHTHGKRLIMESGGLPPILNILGRNQKVESRQIAAAILFYLSSIDEFRNQIGNTSASIPALVDLIRDGRSCGKKNAVVAIFALLLSPENHRRVIDAGGVPLLLKLSTNSPPDREDLATDSLAVLASLSESFDGALALQEHSATHLMTKILCSPSKSRAEKEYCVSILLSLCIYGGEEVIEFLARDASIMASMYSILTEGSNHASMKSRSLIRLLQRFNEERKVAPNASLTTPSPSSSSGDQRRSPSLIAGTRFVHVR